MSPTLPRHRFFAVVYGLLSVGFLVFGLVYALDGALLPAVVFGTISLGECVLAFAYETSAIEIDDPHGSAPSTWYEYGLGVFAVGVLVAAVGLLVGRVG